MNMLVIRATKGVRVRVTKSGEIMIYRFTSFHAFPRPFHGFSTSVILVFCVFLFYFVMCVFVFACVHFCLLFLLLLNEGDWLLSFCWHNNILQSVVLIWRMAPYMGHKMRMGPRVGPHEHKVVQKHIQQHQNNEIAKHMTPHNMSKHKPDHMIKALMVLSHSMCYFHCMCKCKHKAPCRSRNSDLFMTNGSTATMRKPGKT